MKKSRKENRPQNLNSKSKPISKNISKRKPKKVDKAKMSVPRLRTRSQNLIANQSASKNRAEVPKQVRRRRRAKKEPPVNKTHFKEPIRTYDEFCPQQEAYTTFQ